MRIMIKYEIKKVFTKTGNRFALLILLIAVSVVCYFACGISYVNEQGESERGPRAVATLRTMQKEWAGTLNEEKISRVIALNKELTQMPGYNSENATESNIVYSKTQGIEGIRELLNHAFATDFSSYDYYRANSLTKEDAERFYDMRTQSLRDWLSGDETEYMYSDKEKEFLIGRYEAIEKPFYYDYVEGWRQLFEYSMTVIMFTMLALGFITSGIFANEFAWKTDAIFFSTEKGRHVAIRAKLLAGFIIVTAIYFFIICVFSVVTLGYLGADGANCPIQLIQWKSIYNLKIWQEYVLIVLGGYLGCLFISALCMFVSAKTKSSVVAVVIPFVLLFAPSFVGIVDNHIVMKILGLLPDQLLQINMVTVYFNIYKIGGEIVDAMLILFVMYSVFTLILFPATYEVYRKKQID